jgi:hypothetical protein
MLPRVEINVRNNSDSQQRAFALVGLLSWAFVVIVTSTIAAVTVVPGLRDARRMKCRYNMITIGNLLRIHKIKDPNHIFATSVADLKNETPPAPTCPDGGSYRISISDGTAIAQNGQVVPAGEPIITCGCPGHGKYALDIDIK